MQEQKWIHKIGNDAFSFIPSGILLAVFGAVSIWLHRSGNGAHLFTDTMTVLMAVLLCYNAYRFFFVKILVGETGFYHQKGPRDGRYYDYADIAEAWETSAPGANGASNCYLHFRTPEGDVVRFWFTASDAEAVEYMLERICGDNNFSEVETDE